MHSRMTGESLRVLLVEDNPGDARLLEETLREEAGDSFEIEWRQTLEEAAACAQSDPCRVIVLDLNLPDSEGFETFSRMKAAAPETPIVVLTGLEDEQLGLRAIQHGAQDYLVKSELTAGQVVRSVRYAVERHRSRCRERDRAHAVHRGKVIGFVGAKGGVGTSTVVLNVAALLARTTGRSITAAELTGRRGSFPAMLGESPAHTLATLLRFDPATATEEMLHKCLYRAPYGFDVLFSPQQPGEFLDPDGDDLRNLIERLAQRCAYTLLDLPGIGLKTTEAALGCCDAVVLVSERDRGGVAAADAAVGWLRERKAPPAGLVLVNRVLLTDAPSPRAVASELRCDLFGVVPPAPDLAAGAQRVGVPLALHRPLSAPARMLTAIAERVARAVSGPAQPRLPAPQKAVPA